MQVQAPLVQVHMPAMEQTLQAHPTWHLHLDTCGISHLLEDVTDSQAVVVLLQVAVDPAALPAALQAVALPGLQRVSAATAVWC